MQLPNEQAVDRAIQTILILFSGHRAFKSMSFHYALSVPLYFSLGADIGTIAFIESIYWIGNSISRIPAGYLSDRWGYKSSIVLGSVVVFIALAGIGSATDLTRIYICTALIGLGHSLTFGPESPLVMRTLEGFGRASSYQLVESRGWLARNVALAASMIIGSASTIYVSLSAIFFASALTTIPSALCAVLIPTNATQIKPAGSPFAGARELFRGGHLSVLARPAGLFVLFSTIDFVGIWLLQVTLVASGLEIAWLGAAYAVALGVSAAAYLMERYWARFDAITIQLILLNLTAAFLMSSGAMLLTGIGPIGITLGLMALTTYGIFRGVYYPFVRARLVERSPGQLRGTILAIVTVCAALLIAGCNPLLGGLAQRAGLGPMQLALGASLLPWVIALQVFRRRTS